MPRQRKPKGEPPTETTADGYWIVRVRQDGECCVVFDCWACPETHTHGAGSVPGHRTSHCREKDTPAMPGTFYIAYEEDAA